MTPSHQKLWHSRYLPSITVAITITTTTTATAAIIIGIAIVAITAVTIVKFTSLSVGILCCCLSPSYFRSFFLRR